MGYKRKRGINCLILQTMECVKDEVLVIEEENSYETWVKGEGVGDIDDFYDCDGDGGEGDEFFDCENECEYGCENVEEMSQEVGEEEKECGSVSERQEETVRSEEVGVNETVVERQGECMFWEKDGCVGESGISGGRHVRRMHLPSGLYEWDIVTLEEWARELIGLYGLELEDTEGIRKLILRMRIGEGKGWKMSVKGREDFFYQLGLRVGEEVEEGELVEGMGKISFLFHWGVLAELVRGLLSSNRGRLLGWKKGDRRDFGEVIRRGMEGTIKGKEWAGLPIDIKRVIMEGRERARADRKRRENVASERSVEKKLKGMRKSEVGENSVEKKGVEEVERRVSVENESLKVCVRKEAAVVGSKREQWNRLIAGVSDSGERMKEIMKRTNEKVNDYIDSAERRRERISELGREYGEIIKREKEIEREKKELELKREMIEKEKAFIWALETGYHW